MVDHYSFQISLKGHRSQSSKFISVQIFHSIDGSGDIARSRNNTLPISFDNIAILMDYIWRTEKYFDMQFFKNARLSSRLHSEQVSTKSWD